jgi:hypothetical protein
MAEVSGTTLMMAIQAVHAQIRHYEALLKSETLGDAAEIQSLVLSYENAARAGPVLELELLVAERER